MPTNPQPEQPPASTGVAEEIREIAKTLNDGCHNPGNCWSRACERNHKCSVALTTAAEKVERLERENGELKIREELLRTGINQLELQVSGLTLQNQNLTAKVASLDRQLADSNTNRASLENWNNKQRQEIAELHDNIWQRYT